MIKSAKFTAQPLSVKRKLTSFEAPLAGVALNCDNVFYADLARYEEMKHFYGNGGSISFLLQPIPSRGLLTDYLKGLESKYGFYFVRSPLIEANRDFAENYYSTIAQIAGLASLIFLTISALLLLFLFSAYARDRQKEMLLRRAMRESEGRVYWLLALESLVVGILGFALSLIESAIFSAALNAYLSSANHLPLALFSFSLYATAISLLLVLVLSFLASILPAFSGAKKGLATRLKQDE